MIQSPDYPGLLGESCKYVDERVADQVVRFLSHHRK
jgi:hypothetical protein